MRPQPETSDFSVQLALAQQAALDFIDALPGRAVVSAGPQQSPGLPLGIGFERALHYLRERVEPQLSASAGPRYFGFVTGGATPAGLAGDWLVGAYDQNVSHAGGSLAAALEQDTARAFAGLFGLGEGMQGQFVSGATQSNLVALACARQWAGLRSGWDVAEHGLAGAPPVRVFGGSPHSSVGKALSILGMGRASVEQVACLSGRTAIDADALAERLVQNGGRPAIVVASAGEVGTGDFDDIARLAGLCREHGAWLHVDGAFGLFAALDPQRAAWLDGIADADSVTVDLHKWLNVPYDSALVYTRHPALQRQVFRAAAAYLGDSPDPLHMTPENSRRWRALPAWLTLASYGAEGIAEWVQRHCALARRLGEGLAAMPALELLDEVRLNIVSFALRDRAPARRDEFLSRLAEDGRVYLTPAAHGGRASVRAAISNWRTTEADIDLALAAVAAVLQAMAAPAP